jgi:dTDP-4-amino-4,6-dideoxygalactose transaminase
LKAGLNLFPPKGARGNMPSSFEDRLGSAFGYGDVVPFGRGRAGLTALLEEIAEPGAPVVIPSNICVAVLAAVIAAGARPRLAPVSPESGLAEDDRLVRSICALPPMRGVVMPTHLYGSVTGYPKTRQLAAERGWFVLENDSLGATLSMQRQAGLGDALLVSFGRGKSIDGGGGGAILTNDPGLAQRLRRRAQRWPLFDAESAALEEHLVLVRRHLHAIGRPGLSEPLLELDAAACRHRFDEATSSDIDKAIDGFAETNARRMERLNRWRQALSRFAPELLPAGTAPRTAWRAAFRLREPAMRNRVAGALRAAGIDAGTNYQPLTDFAPALLAGQAHADADLWGKTVLTLWLTDDYDDTRIERAADVIGSVMVAK